MRSTLLLVVCALASVAIASAVASFWLGATFKPGQAALVSLAGLPAPILYRLGFYRSLFAQA